MKTNLQDKIPYFLILVLALLCLSLKCTSAGELNISPLSLTIHPRADDYAADRFTDLSLGSKRNTLHPGLHLRYDTDGGVTHAAWAFLDSFGNPAGGYMVGAKFDLFMGIYLGGLGGLYVREEVPSDIKDFPVSVKLSGAEIAPVGGILVGFEVPISETYGIDTSCVVNVIANNCNIGLKLKW